MHVVAPKRNRRQWRNPGWRAKTTDTKQPLGVQRSNLRGAEHADKGVKGAEGWGVTRGRQPSKKRSKRPKNMTWGGPEAAAQLSGLESVALF